jgi:nicotinate-nucleotide adenylyltransferase
MMVRRVRGGERTAFLAGFVLDRILSGRIFCLSGLSCRRVTRLVTLLRNHMMPAATNVARKIGLFGGSFDPVHLGHLWIAQAAWETLGLDVVRWLPAAKNPLKPNAPIASDEQRIAMLRLSIAGDQRFEIDDREIRRGKVSYTVDTLGELAQEQPDASFTLIIGGDSLADFARWHRPEEILKLAQVAAVARGGLGELDYRVFDPFIDQAGRKKIESNEIRMPVIEISSREIRDRAERGRPIRYFVPAAVEAFIDAEKIYGAK